jgi:hypothetical protein
VALSIDESIGSGNGRDFAGIWQEQAALWVLIGNSMF